MFSLFYDSPIGGIRIYSDGKKITGLYFDGECATDTISVLLQCQSELDEYFAGTRKNFEVAVALDGTDFQKDVWESLCSVPYGDTKSYKQIAEAVGRPKAVRAVGNANNRNKISIIIPCHRIVASDGSLAGYGGEIWRKKWLLEHEKGNLKM